MFTKELSLDEIKFGEILFSDESMEMFPMNGEENIGFTMMIKNPQT